MYATDLVYKISKKSVLQKFSIKLDDKSNLSNLVKLSNPIQKQIISSLKKVLFKYTLKYVDFSFEESLIFLRFEKAENAQQALIEEPVGLILEKVSGEEELNYWRHLLACWSDCRMMKSRHRIVGNRYKPVDTKKKLVNK